MLYKVVNIHIASMKVEISKIVLKTRFYFVFYLLTLKKFKAIYCKFQILEYI